MIKLKLKMVFIVIAIIILLKFLWNYLKKTKQCNCEGMTGGMLGHIERKIHPITRPIVRKVKASFSNPTLEYYNNKLYQIFR